MDTLARQKRILKDREGNLDRLLAQGASGSKLAAAIEAVRQAQLSHLKRQLDIAQYEEFKTDAERSAETVRHLAEIDEQMLFWQSIEETEILKRYRGSAN
jgi:hypothetical protein